MNSAAAESSLGIWRFPRWGANNAVRRRSLVIGVTPRLTIPISGGAASPPSTGVPMRAVPSGHALPSTDASCQPDKRQAGPGSAPSERLGVATAQDWVPTPPRASVAEDDVTPSAVTFPRGGVYGDGVPLGSATTLNQAARDAAVDIAAILLRAALNRGRRDLPNGGPSARPGESSAAATSTPDVRSPSRGPGSGGHPLSPSRRK